MPDELEARVSALETRVEEVAADAAAARHLAAARDRDLADLTIKVDAHRMAINALGVQTAERFDRLERRMDGFDQRMDGFDQRMDRLESTVDKGFAEMRAKFDQTAAGMQLIVDLLTPGPAEA
ncbi:MAG TPA: hypothetical protein VIU11_06730 [Nakamurella sp.]